MNQFNHLINQANNQLEIQSINQPKNQSFIALINKANNQSTSKSISQALILTSRRKFNNQ